MGLITKLHVAIGNEKIIYSSSSVAESKTDLDHGEGVVVVFTSDLVICGWFNDGEPLVRSWGRHTLKTITIQDIEDYPLPGDARAGVNWVPAHVLAEFKYPEQTFELPQRRTAPVARQEFMAFLPELQKDLAL
jgi:hypothetical protein